MPGRTCKQHQTPKVLQREYLINLSHILVQNKAIPYVQIFAGLKLLQLQIFVLTFSQTSFSIYIAFTHYAPVLKTRTIGTAVPRNISQQ